MTDGINHCHSSLIIYLYFDILRKKKKESLAVPPTSRLKRALSNLTSNIFLQNKKVSNL